VEFYVVAGFDFGVERATLGKVEPVLDLVCNFVSCLVGLDINLEVNYAFASLGVDLGGEELVVDKVVGDDGVSLLGPLGPGIVFDALGL